MPLPGNCYEFVKDETIEGRKGTFRFTDFASVRWGKTIVGLRKPDHVSEMTIESPGLCGSYLTEAGRPSRQE